MLLQLIRDLRFLVLQLLWLSSFSPSAVAQVVLKKAVNLATYVQKFKIWRSKMIRERREETSTCPMISA
jgi:hypothetical protein